MHSYYPLQMLAQICSSYCGKYVHFPWKLLWIGSSSITKASRPTGLIVLGCNWTFSNQPKGLKRVPSLCLYGVLEYWRCSAFGAGIPVFEDARIGRIWCLFGPWFQVFVGGNPPGWRCTFKSMYVSMPECWARLRLPNNSEMRLVWAKKWKWGNEHRHVGEWGSSLYSMCGKPGLCPTYISSYGQPTNLQSCRSSWGWERWAWESGAGAQPCLCPNQHISHSKHGTLRTEEQETANSSSFM